MFNDDPNRIVLRIEHLDIDAARSVFEFPTISPSTLDHTPSVAAIQFQSVHRRPPVIDIQTAIPEYDHQQTSCFIFGFRWRTGFFKAIEFFLRNQYCCVFRNTLGFCAIVYHRIVSYRISVVVVVVVFGS